MSYIEKEPLIEFITKGLNNPNKDEAFGYDAIAILAEIAYAPTFEEKKPGWECPKCGAVMSPTTSVCVNCRGNHYNISNEKNLQEEMKKYLNYIHTGDYPEAHYETTSTSSHEQGGETYLYNKCGDKKEISFAEAHVAEREL